MKENKVMCPSCGKEWKVKKIKRTRISGSEEAIPFDINENDTLYVDTGKVNCPECGTEIQIY
ncbi:MULTISPECIES: hypothetical protein [Clostridia]|uniref:hypothetical protein n=1 Tax=Clostridia TaxID=186801 RepID=UPI00067F1784|nr:MULTISPECIES: hypothetical protein [Clostridia]